MDRACTRSMFTQVRQIIQRRKVIYKILTTKQVVVTDQKSAVDPFKNHL